MVAKAIVKAYKPKKPPIKADDLKDPKRKEAKVKTGSKQTQIERNEASINKASKTSKDYGKRKSELQRLFRTAKGEDKAKYKRQLASLEAKAELEKVMAIARRSGSKKVTLGSMRSGKADKDFNKGGMAKKPKGKK
jgi:hypothetical protein|tara:strand:+ start:238 stop:645 length:408 start_codon:yes stop_codon:yes gene_type:complete